jgi:cytochrome c biogenesis protein CcdA
MKHTNASGLGDLSDMTKKEYLTQIMLIIGIMVVFLIIILGIYILLSPTFDHWPKYVRVAFSIAIIGYGFYRSVNIFHQYKNKEDKQ